MCVCILDMKGARTRAKWLGGCISAEYTKGSLSRSVVAAAGRENRILAQMSAECYTHIRGMCRLI
jgi:hypothetical protein